MPSPTGFRAMTPGIYQAYERADLWGPQTAVSKKRAHTAFNSCTKYLGLRGDLIELMNKLLSFSKDIDWDGSSRPLVWPDNQRLLEQCALGSLSALKRALRTLAEAGLIAFKDSPTGRRIGHRNAHDNKIVLDRTYGIDLSPLGLKTPELESIVAVNKAQQQDWRDLCQQYTRDRRRLVSIIEAGRDEGIPGPWEECADEHDAIHSQRSMIRDSKSLAVLAMLHDRLLIVLERANAAYAEAAKDFPSRTSDADALSPVDKSRVEAQEEVQKTGNMDPVGAISEPLIQNTSPRNIYNLYKDERRSADAEQLDLPGTGFASEEGSRNEPARAAAIEQDPQRLARPVDDKTLLALCPEFAEFVRPPRRWMEIVFAAERVIAPMMKIPTSTWASACRLLGREKAAAAVALIYEKHSAQIIDSPGAYLNGMIDRAQKGKLDLPSSLFHWRKPRKNAKNRADHYSENRPNQRRPDHEI
ncbi:plasmid replication protein RepC [Brucella intermedia]|uniref:Putative plasmid replication protein n=1 Tax=Brucella intermedia M86 TaxID=1234597 RepID=M5K5J7_9HYPH|nr:plasmid replication protein RepC [Brucella intermedia]ELT51186.1 putative plasmid replication protein [Brucella intermedia M86]